MDPPVSANLYRMVVLMLGPRVGLTETDPLRRGGTDVTARATLVNGIPNLTHP
ncbi:MAG: hypothetical protein ABI967_04400 [bacterium]